MSEATNMFANYLFSTLMKKITVPSEYHDQIRAVKEMQSDDLSGLVDSLTDFSIASASVDFTIDTDNEEFTKILTNWLERINIGYKGKVPIGINELAKEYFKERWKYSSFPVLKISKWEASPAGLLLPTKMFFVDSECIYAKDKNDKDENLTLFSYDYYLGQNEDNLLDKNVIFSRPYGRWFDEYSIPYLIKRGIYHNWRIIQSLKDMQSKILDQIIPYMLLIKKGTAQLTNQQNKTYSNSELKDIIGDFQQLLDGMRASNAGDKSIKSPIRATNFDEEIEHKIPSLGVIMDTKLFAQAERNILAGLGFIDIVEAVSTSRRESVLNPKAFIKEINAGVEDFKNHILKPLIFMIQEKNKKHIKYMNVEFYICSSPVSIFHTDAFKNQLRLMWERGQLSNKTYAEVVGEVEYRTELARREQEAKNGDEYTMYPHLTKNDEDKGIDFVGKEPEQKDTDKNGNPIPTDKIDDKEKFDIGAKFEVPVKCPKCKHVFDLPAETEAGMGWVKCPKCGKAVTQKNIIKSKDEELVTAPYNKVAELPDNVKKRLSPKKQRDWIKIFNNAYRFYMKKFGDAEKAESLAFRTAWSQIKQVKSKKKILKKKKK